MKLIIGSTALALLLFGASLYGQEPDKDKPKEEPKKEESAKPAPAKKQEPPKQEEKAKPEPAKQQPKPEERNQPARQQDHPVQQQQQQRTETRTETRTDARTVQQHNNNQAHRQPDEKFRAQIGREHHFRVTRSEDRRVSYGGYYFTYSEAWPSDWDYNDDVYIDYLDGQYYLIDPRHSGVRLLLVVAD
jgi:hypothetical protein